MKVIHWIALILIVIGALTWGMVGFCDIDVISSIFGKGSAVTRIIFALVGLAGLWSFSFFKHLRCCDPCKSDPYKHDSCKK